MERGAWADPFYSQEEPYTEVYSETPSSMSPPAGDVAQTPEPKTSSGFASVFKNLTGGRSSRSPNAQSPPPNAQQHNATSAPQPAIYGGPPNFEQLYEQLKAGNSLVDRASAAQALRIAVQDYPITSVTNVFRQGKDLIEPTNPRECRTAGFELLTACVKHPSATDPERLAYFRILTAPANPEDFHQQIISLIALAKNGRDLSGFHYETLPLLTTWLRETFVLATAARKQRSSRSQKIITSLPEEANLELLFIFIIDIIKFSFTVESKETTSALINEVIVICGQATSLAELKHGVAVLDAIVTYGDIPRDKLADCIKVLCSIHCMVDVVQPEAWRSISNLARSHNGQTTVRILLDILRNPAVSTRKQTVPEIRGALSVLEKLFAKDCQDGYPLVPFTLLMGALTKAVEVENAKVESDMLRLVLSLLNNDKDDGGINENVMEEDWSLMFEVVTKCSQRVLESPDGRTIIPRSRLASPLAKEGSETSDHTTTLAHTLYLLIIRVEALINKYTGVDFFQREDCIRFFVSVYPHLPESCAKMVIDHYMDNRYCYPSDLSWKENIKVILEGFFADRRQPTHIRLHALKAITDVFEVIEMMEGHETPDTIEVFITSILDNIGDEKDISVLQEIMAFAVSVAENADDALFEYIIDCVKKSVIGNRIEYPLSSPPGSRHSLVSAGKHTSVPIQGHLVQTPSNVVTKGLIHIFMRAMDKSTSKVLRVYDELLWIAKSRDCEPDARISALKMLFRLRADWAHRIFLTPFTESDGLAVTLYRTQASLARKQAADEAAQQLRASRVEDTSSPRMSRSTSFGQGHPQARQPYRTGSGVVRTLQRNHQLWMCPDPDALPEQTSGKASLLLVSIIDATPVSEHVESAPLAVAETSEAEVNTEDEAPHASPVSKPYQTTLNVGLYLDTVIGLIRDGCDWEIYSYVLVHLASQLTNQALFKAAIPQVKLLRELLCDQIKNNSFQEPPLSSGLRKADVSICLFQILNMVMSYHRHFTKSDQDDIVRTFLQGVGERTSKCCIHALSICCHELPASTSKSLVNILNRMSQIITQSHVAIHVLEFLTCLARLPNLYVNFREEDYRIVFAICFRYLQYVRDQELKETPNRNSQGPSARNSGVSVEYSRKPIDNSPAESNFQPNTSDELPQYVYALAYHVIVFWFLSLKLADRAGQVTWITKNLVSTDIYGREKIDEQAHVTLDFMQRVAYADVDESDADPSFNEEAFGEIKKRRWIIGNSLVTVEQAIRGDWAQITKRQPSGTSCYIIQERFIQPPAHQAQAITDAMKDGRHSDENMKLPSHLFLQLTASTPQGLESMRPIPLPSDDYMDRFIRIFNGLPTVDGHKVGVIYIGENQSNEVEILSNIQGSSDYTAFLSGLGTLTRLKGANFNTQGLDRRTGADGEYTFCWRDRVTEIVFHVTTQMPTNLQQDPQCNRKKSHIGNDYVNIVFNNSGLPFRYDTFPSQFNYVNIVITPESRASFAARRMRNKSAADTAFYKVQVMSKPGFPELSPAAETKIVSLSALPCFIRLLALNASVFSGVWAKKDGQDNVSSWRKRLLEINRLRDRYSPKAPTASSTPTSPPGTSNGVSAEAARNIRDSMTLTLRRQSVANLNFFSNPAADSASQRSSMISTADTEVGPTAGEESLVDSLDFSRWA